MLYRKRPVIFLCLVTILTYLTACAGNQNAKNFEQSLAADPRLKDNPVGLGVNQANQTQTPQPEATPSLPEDFPKEIPLYPNAKLQEITPNSQNQTATRWQSVDPSNFIASFYRNQFQTNNWQIIQQPSDDTSGVFEAKRDNLLVRVSIQPQPVTSGTPNQALTSTELRIEYSPNGTAFAPITPTTTAQTPQTAQPTTTPTPGTTNPTDTTNNLPQPGNPEFIGPLLPQDQIATTTTPTTSATPIPFVTTPATSVPFVATPATTFSDIKNAPQQLQRYIQELAALGVLPINSQAKNNANTNLFEPGKTITRREYARWLVTANNAMYANNPAKQIRLAVETTQPVFSDVPKNHPDFPIIQGLADAGLIPSPLSGDSTEVLFRPDAPLSREQLILWKVPLDTRQALPAANLDAVKQTWGFQDIGKIDARALRAVLADYQNGEQSNIRRVFGYTTLFQPKKPTTRAEAAATLWYFGIQGDGVSASDALKLKQ